MPSNAFVTVHALSAGYLTLSERFFVTPLEDIAVKKTVPSLSFLIQHVDPRTKTKRRIIFDLGVRRQLDAYADPIYKHAMTRQPLSGDPDTVKSLAKGGLSPSDIDMIIFSHLHWDHIGTPSDYPTSTYVVGPGAASLIDGSRKHTAGSHNHFEEGLLDPKRTIQLPPTGLPATPPPNDDEEDLDCQTQRLKSLFCHPWTRKGRFEAVMDIFNDGSVYIVSAPGHLTGHVNLLCRLETGKHVYLAGDACHDARLLTGEKDIATWTDDVYPGVVCCIHQDIDIARKTITAIRDSMRDPGDLVALEVVFAHDAAWEAKAKASGKYFPGSL